MSRTQPNIREGKPPYEVSIVCNNCSFWRPERLPSSQQEDNAKLMRAMAEAKPMGPRPKEPETGEIGGCARYGTTTTYVGEFAWRHHTTDLSSCSAFEMHPRFTPAPPPMTDDERVIAERKRNEQIRIKEDHRIR